MDYNKTFESFNTGKLVYQGKEISLDALTWNNHPTFEGVSLKHIVTSKESNGLFSYHLVSIAPNCKIGKHIHELQLETHEVISGSGYAVTKQDSVINYAVGVLAIFDKKVPHEVIAGDNGLCLFAKFMPALV